MIPGLSMAVLSGFLIPLNYHLQRYLQIRSPRVFLIAVKHLFSAVYENHMRKKLSIFDSAYKIMTFRRPTSGYYGGAGSSAGITID